MAVPAAAATEHAAADQYDDDDESLPPAHNERSVYRLLSTCILAVFFSLSLYAFCVVAHLGPDLQNIL